MTNPPAIFDEHSKNGGGGGSGYDLKLNVEHGKVARDNWPVEGQILSK